LAAGLAPLAFFPISIYLDFPEIKKRLPVEGNRRARCLEGGSNVIGAGRWRDLE
jgi:hypothetical protein